ncbi:hypothetical protein [Nitrosococcus oceani]|nr:hypothetical protein [Nitrosococcus oceani]
MRRGGEYLRKWLEERPDLTLTELCERYEQQRGLKRLKISRKKNVL